MDSFAQQMLNEIERRYKAYQLSNNSISLNEEYDAKENKNNPNEQQQPKFSQKLNNVKDIELDDCACALNEVDVVETMPNKDIKPEMIYANSNVIKQNETNDTSVNYNPVPIGRKPALPPKPPNPLRLSLIKPKEYTCITMSNRKSSQGKKDPAEMSLKERLALFEKNKGKVLIPKAPLGMSIPIKQIPMNIEQKSVGHTTSPRTSHTSTLIKTVQHRKPTICDIDIENEDPIKLAILEPKCNHVKDENQPKTIVDDVETPTVKDSDVFDSCRASSSPKPLPPARKTDQTPKIESIDGEKVGSDVEDESFENHMQNRNSDKTYTKTNYDIQTRSTLYGDLTPIVTTIAPAKMQPDETIGLNELHQNTSSYSLLNDSNQYKAKEEDRWERFIECLLFFCCVA